MNEEYENKFEQNPTAPGAEDPQPMSTQPETPVTAEETVFPEETVVPEETAAEQTERRAAAAGTGDALYELFTLCEP